MPYGNEIRAAEGIVPNVQKHSRMICAECGGNRVRRVERRGFMQKHIYPFFGFFPWYCRKCNHYFILRKRNRTKSSDKHYVERGS